MNCALDGNLRASPSGPPTQAPCGVGCVQRPSHEHERPAPRLRVQPFPAILIPAGTTASADFSTAGGALSDATVPHHPTSGAHAPDGHPGTPMETSPDKTSNLHRTPTASTQRPLDDIGLRCTWPARPDRPASYAQHTGNQRSAGAPCVPRVAISSSPASFPPASRRSSCHRLVVGAINLHRGLAPPSCWSCRAYQRAPASRPAHQTTTFRPTRSLARVKSSLTPMRRGRLPTTSCRHVRVHGLERPSGRNAPPSGITPSNILSPARSHGSWTEARLGARAHTIRSIQRAHAPPPHARASTLLHQDRLLDTRRRDK